MEDRFKFRVFLKYNQIMCDIDSYCFLQGLNKCVFHFTNGGQKTLKNDDYILMQCTGLKDKNGKLIYDGDILKGKKDMICSPHSSKMVDKVGVVEIPQNMFVASCRDVKNNCTLFCQNDWVKTEVIGNIYQNPELLED